MESVGLKSIVKAYDMPTLFKVLKEINLKLFLLKRWPLQFRCQVEFYSFRTGFEVFCYSGQKFLEVCSRAETGSTKDNSGMEPKARVVGMIWRQR